MKKKLSLILIVVMVLSVFSTVIFATEVTTGNENLTTGTASEQDIMKQDLFEIQNKDYVMDELVDGNAFIMANGDVRVTGEINGAAYIMANGTVELSEESLIMDAVYVMAKKVIVKGAICDIYSMSQSFEMTSSAYVERDVNILAGEVKLRGEINRNVSISAEKIDVKDEKDMLEINGDFSYSSPTEIEDLDEVVSNGEIKYTQQNEEEEVLKPSAVERVKSYGIDIIASMVYVLVVYFLFKLLSPKFNERIGKDLKEKSIVGFAIGLLFYVLLVIVAVLTIILLLTIVGAPVAVFAWILLILGIFISPAVFQIAVLEIVAQKYEKIKENTGYTILTLLGICLCVSVLKIIPYIGGIVGFVVLTIGIGLLVRNIFSREEKKEEVKEEI